MNDKKALAEEMLSWLSTALCKDPESVNAHLLQVAADQAVASLNAMDSVIRSRWLDEATGASLDAIGARYSIYREGDGDAEYRARIVHEIDMMLSYGTVADVKRYVADKLGMEPADIEVVERHLSSPDAVFTLRIHGQPTKEVQWDIVNSGMDSVRPVGVLYYAEDIVMVLLPIELVLDAGQFTRCYVWLPACSGWGYMQWGTCPWGGGEETVTIECSGFEKMERE